MTTATGVRVAFGGDGAVTVTAPASLRGQVCGVCAQPEEGDGGGEGTQCREWGRGMRVDTSGAGGVVGELETWDGGMEEEVKKDGGMDEGGWRDGGTEGWMKEGGGMEEGRWRNG